MKVRGRCRDKQEMGKISTTHAVGCCGVDGVERSRSFLGANFTWKKEEEEPTKAVFFDFECLMEAVAKPIYPFILLCPPHFFCSFLVLTRPL
jgi:hypothetical protein